MCNILFPSYDSRPRLLEFHVKFKNISAVNWFKTPAECFDWKHQRSAEFILLRYRNTYRRVFVELYISIKIKSCHSVSWWLKSCFLADIDQSLLILWLAGHLWLGSFWDVPVFFFLQKEMRVHKRRRSPEFSLYVQSGKASSQPI